MREESAQYEVGIILQEFGKGSNLRESQRLLHLAMIKVSSGPGPALQFAKSEDDEAPKKI